MRTNNVRLGNPEAGARVPEILVTFSPEDKKTLLDATATVLTRYVSADRLEEALAELRKLAGSVGQ